MNNVKEWAPICAFLGEKFKKKGNCHILSKKYLVLFTDVTFYHFKIEVYGV